MAIGLDGQAIGVGAGSGPFTLNHTCGGVQRLLVMVFSGIRNAATGWSVSGATYNGSALTYQAAGQELGNSRAVRTEIWTLVNPPAGSAYSLSVTPSVGLLGYSLAAISLSGVDQASPVGVTGADNGQKSAFSVGLTTTVADAWLVGGAGIRNGTRSWSPGSSVVEAYEQASGGSTTDDVTACGIYRVCTSTGLYALDSTASGSDRGVLAGIEVKPAAAAPSVWFGAELMIPAPGIRVFQ